MNSWRLLTPFFFPWKLDTLTLSLHVLEKSLFFYLFVFSFITMAFEPFFSYWFFFFPSFTTFLQKKERKKKKAECDTREYFYGCVFSYCYIRPFSIYQNVGILWIFCLKKRKGRVEMSRCAWFVFSDMQKVWYCSVLLHIYISLRGQEYNTLSFKFILIIVVTLSHSVILRFRCRHGYGSLQASVRYSRESIVMMVCLFPYHSRIDRKMLLLNQVLVCLFQLGV